MTSNSVIMVVDGKMNINFFFSLSSVRLATRSTERLCRRVAWRLCTPLIARKHALLADEPLGRVAVAVEQRGIGAAEFDEVPPHRRAAEPASGLCAILALRDCVRDVREAERGLVQRGASSVVAGVNDAARAHAQCGAAPPPAASPSASYYEAP